MEDDQNKPVRRVAAAHFKEEMPIPPPPGFVSPFQTIEEWLIAVCQADQPEKAIAEFCFLFFGVSNDYLLCLVGYNNYREEDHDIRRIDFKPSPMFFALPENVYGILPMEDARRRILTELVDFTQTTVFQNSFLSKSSCITTSFSEDIWPVNYND
jgi:hypothetical protein